MKKKIAFLVLPAIALGMAQTKPAPVAPPDRLPDTYQIYSLLMPGQVFKDMDAGAPWAISDTTINEDDMNPKLAPDAFLQPPETNARAFVEAVGDYRQRKQERMVLTRRFSLSRPYKLMKSADADQFRAAKGSIQSSSSDQSPYLGITYFSEVYFNVPQTAALVYILDWCGNLCSQSAWVYLEKQNGAWTVRSGKAPPQT
jgi:hypothetical protein